MFTKSWFNAALIRAVRTFAEAALAYIGTGPASLEMSTGSECSAPAPSALSLPFSWPSPACLKRRKDNPLIISLQSEAPEVSGASTTDRKAG